MSKPEKIDYKTVVIESVNEYVVKDLADDFIKGYKLLAWAVENNQVFLSDKILIVRIMDLPKPLVVIEWQNRFDVKPKAEAKVKMYKHARFGWSFPTLDMLKNQS